jgi:hypothetical protein
MRTERGDGGDSWVWRRSEEARGFAGRRGGARRQRGRREERGGGGDFGGEVVAAGRSEGAEEAVGICAA